MNPTTQPALHPVTVHSMVSKPVDLTARPQLDRWVLPIGSVVEVLVVGGEPVGLEVLAVAGRHAPS